MDEDLKKMLEENLALTREVRNLTLKIHRYFIWQRIVSVIYLVLVLGPIIWAVIYLPPLVKPYWDQYQSLLQLDPTGKASGGQDSLLQILKNSESMRNVSTPSH